MRLSYRPLESRKRRFGFDKTAAEERIYVLIEMEQDGAPILLDRIRAGDETTPALSLPPSRWGAYVSGFRRMTSNTSRPFSMLGCLAMCAIGLIAFAPNPASAQPRYTRLSVTPGGTQPSNFSYTPVLSGDGRFVAFSSSATDVSCGRCVAVSS